METDTMQSPHPHPLVSLLTFIGSVGSFILSYVIANVYVTDFRVWSSWAVGITVGFVGVVANWKSFQANWHLFSASVNKRWQTIKKYFSHK